MGQGLEGTILPPEKPSSAPANAQWLSGQGVGVWFAVSIRDEHFFIQRYSAEGKLDCEGYFELEGERIFDLNEPYQFTHISHCAKCRIEQNGNVLVFHRIEA